MAFRIKDALGREMRLFRRSDIFLDGPREEQMRRWLLTVLEQPENHATVQRLASVVGADTVR